MKVIVYASKFCPKCILVKQYLLEHKVEFEERNIGWKTYREELISKGILSVPAVVVGDDTITFSDMDMTELNDKLAQNNLGDIAERRLEDVK